MKDGTWNHKHSRRIWALLMKYLYTQFQTRNSNWRAEPHIYVHRCIEGDGNSKRKIDNKGYSPGRIGPQHGFLIQLWDFICYDKKPSNTQVSACYLYLFYLEIWPIISIIFKILYLRPYLADFFETRRDSSYRFQTFMMIFSEFFMPTFLANGPMKYSIHCSHTTLQRCGPTKNICWMLCLEK